MSVYGGFATRMQETKYNQLTETLVDLLQLKVQSIYQLNEVDDQEWTRQVSNTLKTMSRMEQLKFSWPRFSEPCESLLLPATKPCDLPKVGRDISPKIIQGI